MKAVKQFNVLFEVDSTPTVLGTPPTPRQTLSEPYLSDAGAVKLKLTREQADELIQSVELARKAAGAHDGYEQEHLDTWDEYWSGIGRSLRQYHQPHVTIKMLMWCFRSLTKSGSADAMPAWFQGAIDSIRKFEKDLSRDRH